MARAIWSGSISFGLVNVPVKLHSAVRSKDVHFHQIDEKDGSRIRNKRVNESTGREVPNDRIVKAYEIDEGTYVPMSDDELESAEPERTHTIEVEAFVDVDDIDPMQYDDSYWIAPEDTKGASKAYALLRDAMDETGRVAIGRFVMRTKEHLVLARPVGNALVLHTLRYPDELVNVSDVDGLPVRAKSEPRELKMAEQLVDSLTVEWKPSRYHDTHREKLLGIIERKAKGEDVVVEPKHEPAAEVVDLMAALEASIEANKKKGSSRSGSRKRSA